MNKFLSNNKIERLLIPVLSFTTPFVILFLALKNMGFYPFGEKSLLIMDMNNQYVHFYESLRQIASGESSIFFSWSKAMGTNFIGLFAYYLSSPLSFLILLFDKNDIQTAIFFLTLLKISLCGLTSYIYIAKVMKYKRFPMLLFTTSYALMSYNIVYSMCLMWIDGVILLPIVLFGAEKILRNEKPYVFIISLLTIFISNYYISYSICVFTALFTTFRYFTVYDDATLKSFLKIAARLTGYALLSVGMSLWLLLPVFFDLTAGKIGYRNMTYQSFLNFPFTDYIQAFKPYNYTSITNSGKPFLYNNIIIMLLCVSYFFIKAVTLKKKVLTLLFFIFMICSFLFSNLDSIWHALQYPNWFPYRYSYVFHFLVVYTAFNAFSSIKKINKSIAVVSGALLFVCFDIYVNTTALINGLNNEFAYRNASDYIEYKNNLLPLVENIKETDDSFYRIEKTELYSHNDALSLGYKGVTHFSSLFNAEFLKTTVALGMAQDYFWNGYMGSTILTDSIFSIKYIISRDTLLNYYTEIDSNNGYKAYVNPFVLPLGFMVDSEAFNIPFGTNYIKNQNNLLNTLSGNNIEYFTEIKPLDGKLFAQNDYPVYILRDKANIMYYGQFNKGDEIVFGNSVNAKAVYYLDVGRLSETLSSLSEGGLYNVTYANSHIKAEVNALEQGLMFMSVPYDKGFTVLIDGNKTEYTSIYDTFLIFEVEKGHHKVEITYIPRGFTAGLCISAISFILLTFYIIRQYLIIG